MDAVQAANSGHPGTPMALAPCVYELWNKRPPVRSAGSDLAEPRSVRALGGHASMLLYSMLHLTQTQGGQPDVRARSATPTVSLDDIKKFRQLDSKCPGHPEYRWTSGVETTTGPLGQGVATSVGMAIARRWLGAHFNKPGFAMFDYDVYALGGDGCMMEGISQRGGVARRAPQARRTSAGSTTTTTSRSRATTSLAFTDDVATRFIGYGWNVTRVGDANDLADARSARSRRSRRRPIGRR